MRQQLQMGGLLPPRVVGREVEVARARAALRAADGGPSSGLGSYRLLAALRETNRQAFYSLLQQDPEGLLPLIYTPTMGDACLQWSTLIPRPLGLYASAADAGHMDAVVASWPQQQVRLAVVTDGERILGLGDLGCNGMGVPVGKCDVYAAAGINPDWLLPVMLDVGTNNAELRLDPLYIGLPQPRLRGEAYTSLVVELVEALQRRYGPGIIIHWEDLGAANAFQLLQQLRAASIPTFNDDIECTAAVAVAAVLGALRLPGVVPLREQTFLFYGAGQAALGTARLLVRALQLEGLAESAARQRMWLVDSRGLLLKGRQGLSAQKEEFAQDPHDVPAAALAAAAPVPVPGGGGGGGGVTPAQLARLVAALRPTTLIGAAAVGGAFDHGVVEALVQGVAQRAGPSSRPVLLPLSNPATKAEVSFAHAYAWSGGRAVYASGTRMPAVEVEAEGGGGGRKTGVGGGTGGGRVTGSSGRQAAAAARSRGGGDVSSSSRGGDDGGGVRLRRPAQANNCLVFPGVGLGVIASGAAAVNDDMLLAAARALAGMLSPQELAQETVLPGVSRLREAAAAVAAAVAAAAVGDALSSVTVDSTRCVAELRRDQAAAGGGGDGSAWPGAQASEPGVSQTAVDTALECIQRLMFVA